MAESARLIAVQSLIDIACPSLRSAMIFKVGWLPLDGSGHVGVEGLCEAIERDAAAVALVSVMWANNEVGTVQPIATLAAVAAAHPDVVLSAHLRPAPKGRVICLAAGKGAAAMAAAAERHYLDALGLDPVRLIGIATTRHGHGVPTRRIRVIEAGHPVPDEAGLKAADDTLRQAAEATADDLLLVLISGGASAANVWNISRPAARVRSASGGSRRPLPGRSQRLLPSSVLCCFSNGNKRCVQSRRPNAKNRRPRPR